ncbi:MAG: hypothetical protein KAJ29_06550 [Alphaproteobacteria bacterium]|nr:hypothetical protein [Alphaproteobacteria bacterium]
MVHLINIRRFPVAGLWILAAILTLAFVFPQHALAGGRYNCGKVSHGIVKDTYVAARKVAFLIDAQETLDEFCQSAESLNQWEKENRFARRNRDYKNARSRVIKSSETALRSLRGHLVALRGLCSCGSNKNVPAEFRQARAKKARERAESAMQRVSSHVAQIEMLKETYKQDSKE